MCEKMHGQRGCVVRIGFCFASPKPRSKMLRTGYARDKYH